MTDGWKEFNVEAYNARLASLTRKPYAVAAKEARAAAREVPALLESAVLPVVLEALRTHPKVGQVWRQNTGAHEIDGRYVAYAFPGCADILGWLKDGRFLAVEVKRPGGQLPGGQLTAEQASFLANVRVDGGVAFVATGVDDVWRALKSI